MMLRAQAIERLVCSTKPSFLAARTLTGLFASKQPDGGFYYNPAVVVQHVKRASYRNNPQAAYEFERAMWLFYRKHYRATTPALAGRADLRDAGIARRYALMREILNDSGGKQPPSPEGVRVKKDR